MPACHHQAVLDKHNEYRQRHGAPPLQWSNECMVYAQKCADENSKNRRLKQCFLVTETTSRQMGQNIYLGGGPAENAIDYWYQEMWEPGYNFDKPGHQEGSAHFTAIVWYDTTHVGMARSQCGTYLVANYFPAGNWIDVDCYRKNVLPPSAAYAWRPRNGFEARLSEHFLKIASEKEKKNFTDDSMTVPTRTLFETLWHMGEKKLAEAVLDSDFDNDGSIDAGEFTKAACSLQHGDGSNSKDLQKSVARVAGIVTVDMNGDNKLDPQEFNNYLKVMTNRAFSEEESRDLMAQFDTDGDGLLDYEELVALHDSGALLQKPSVLIERWNRDLEKLVEGVPLIDIVRTLKAHIRQGGTARVTRTENQIIVKLIITEEFGKTRFKTLTGNWTEEEATAAAALQNPMQRRGSTRRSFGPRLSVTDADVQLKRSSVPSASTVKPRGSTELAVAPARRRSAA